jgi:acyl transferase domain-containing protein/acyl carrier protein
MAAAGVSSFGFGGTNAHVVLEEAAQVSKAGDGDDAERARGAGTSVRWCVLPVSGRGVEALRAQAEALSAALERREGAVVEDICYTAGARRSHHEQRVACVGRTCEELAAGLRSYLNGEPAAGVFVGELQPARPSKFLESIAQRPKQVVRTFEERCSLRGYLEERRRLVQTLAALYAAGEDIDWESLYGRGRRRVHLPTYRFQRRRYWFEDAPKARPPRAAAISPSEAELSVAAQQWLYDLYWRECSREGSPSALRHEPGQWVIFCDRGGVGAELARRLEALCGECIRVFAGEGFNSCQRDYKVNPAAPEDFSRLLKSLVQNSSGRAPYRGMVYVWGLDATPAHATTADSLRADQRIFAAPLLHLVAALSRQPGSAPLRLRVLTRRAQAVAASSDAPAPSQATLWGLGRALGLEHPECWGGLFDLDGPAHAAHDLDAVVAELLSPDGEEQVAWRGGRRYVARLRRHIGQTLSAVPRLAEGAYLITGGLGGIGLTLAQRLAAHGARELILTSRRPVPTAGEPAGEAGRVIEALRELERLGARVDVAQVDVGDPAQMQRLCLRLRRDGTRLGGIIHAAGVMALRPLIETDLAQFEQVMAPKLAGGWLLHELSLELRPEQFILCSSAAAVWGSQGLGAYAAANHFLDALAHHRRRLGLPALSVNWGPWGGAGMRAAMGAESAAAEVLAQLGVRGLEPLTAGEVLLRLAGAGLTQVTVADVEWERFRPAYEARAGRRLLEEISVGAAGSVGGDGAGELTRRLKSVRREQRAELLSAEVAAAVGEVLGLSVDELERRRGFFEMGMDSLVAVELARRLRESLGCEVTAMSIFNHPTVESLTEHLLRNLFPPASSPESFPQISALSTEAEARLLQEIEELSEAEAEALLRSRIGIIEGSS